MKKGFTLIELLAVIVILAVIALIVTPIVTGIIKSAKEQANARSVEGHVKNIENAIILNAFARAGDMKAFDNKTKTEIEAIVTAENDPVTCSSYTILNGTVQSAEGCTVTGWAKTYTYTIGNGATAEIPVVFNGTYVAPGENDTHLGIVYLDPTDVSVECTASSTITTTPDGCKKFYIYADDGSTYKMINDRNIGEEILYSNDTGSDMNPYFTETFESITEGWNAAGTADLIDVRDALNILGITFDPDEQFLYFDTSEYSWLLDNLSGSEQYGYWTKNNLVDLYDGYMESFVVNFPYAYQYIIDNLIGDVGFTDYGGRDTGIGIRPVLIVNQSLIGA